jgi:hypothetical protein
MKAFAKKDQIVAQQDGGDVVSVGKCHGFMPVWIASPSDS